MRIKNFFLTLRALKYIQNNPNCTIPQIREFCGIKNSTPPSREEKDLYKIVSYLANKAYIKKITNKYMQPRGAHYFLKVTPKGSDIFSSFKEIFSTPPLEFKLKENEERQKAIIDSKDLSSDFSKYCYDILKSLELGLIDQLPQDARWILRSKRSRINKLVENCHMKLQEKFVNMMDSVI